MKKRDNIQDNKTKEKMRRENSFVLATASLQTERLQNST